MHVPVSSEGERSVTAGSEASGTALVSSLTRRDMFSQLWSSPLCQFNVGDNMKVTKNIFVIHIYIIVFLKKRLFNYK